VNTPEEVAKATDLVRAVTAKLEGPQFVYVMLNEYGTGAYASVFASLALAQAHVIHCLEEDYTDEIDDLETEAGRAMRDMRSGGVKCLVGTDQYSIHKETVYT
jgi:hypothetical protein